MTSPANILVGCGGSGIQTLMRLNGLMAEDPYWRYRIAKDVYYVLLDTEMAMIDEFEATVAQQLAGVDKPLTWSLRVAQGHVILQPLVRRHFIKPFEDGQNPTGKERLYEHWWNHEKYGPFTAPKVKPLTRGAGQCPAVSYFLTWQSLRSVEDVFDRLIEEMIARRSVAGEDPLAELNFCIVSGLAGGTGRGSWQLIAFKVRELLTEKYGIPAPVAYLFDSGVFENIYRRYPRQEVPMMVNSLTGVSELSCWMQNLATAGNHVFRYQLPSMESPADPLMDVLSLDVTLDTSMAAPVDNAFMVFSGHQLAVLSDNVQYHEMVGTGLYAALTRSAINSKRINDSPPFKSLGTATFEVNASTLRRYFEGLSRINTLKVLSSLDEPAVDAAVEEFLTDCQLRLNVTMSNRKGYSPDDKGSLMQRACSEFLQRMNQRFAGLEEALEADEPEEVEAQIKFILKPAEDDVEWAVEAAVEGLECQPEDRARELAEQLLRDTRSVQSVRRFVEQVIAQLELELSELPAPNRMKLDRDSDPLALFEEYKSREYLGLFGRHFNEEERHDLGDQVRKAALYANYGALREEITQRYKSWMELIRRWQTSADMIRATADKLTAKFKNELQRDIRTTGCSSKDFFDALFADFDNPDRHVPDEFAKGRFYRRELKPVLRRGEDLELLGPPEFNRELAEVLERALLTTGLDRNAYDELDKLRRDLETAIRRTVHLPLRFVENNFSLRKVVHNVRQAWLRCFSAAKGRTDRLRELVNRFETFFGVQPQLDGEEFTMPTESEFLLQMGASLAATCRPYWRIRDADQTESARVLLFLPILDDQFDKEAAEKFVHDKLSRANVLVEVLTEQERPDELGESRANPFTIVAYSEEGTHDIGQIASLDYWQTPSVKKLLMKCEDPGCESVFDQTTEHNGVSFTDPLFVKAAAVKDARWKPWLDKDVNQQVQANEVYDALLYGLLEVNDHAGTLQAASELVETLKTKNWTFPLIRDKRQRWYQFTRRALMWNGGKAKEDTACPWKTRVPIAQGLHQVFDVLAGNGRKDGSLRLEGVQWADRLRQESREFWSVVLHEMQAPKNSKPYNELLAALEEKIDRELQKLSDDDHDLPIWRGLADRLRDLRARDEL